MKDLTQSLMERWVSLRTWLWHCPPRASCSTSTLVDSSRSSKLWNTKRFLAHISGYFLWSTCSDWFLSFHSGLPVPMALSASSSMYFEKARSVGHFFFVLFLTCRLAPHIFKVVRLLHSNPQLTYGFARHVVGGWTASFFVFFYKLHGYTHIHMYPHLLIRPPWDARARLTLYYYSKDPSCYTSW